MKHSQISPDDPKLTAYALGELPADERAAFEAALANDAGARAAVEEIRAFAGRLEAALAHEPDPLLRQAYGGQAAPPGTARRRILRFPQIAWVGGTLAAACVAVLVALHPRQPRPDVRNDRFEHVDAAAPAGGGIRRSGPTAQASAKRSEYTPPTAQSGATPSTASAPMVSGVAGEGTTGVAGVADPGRPGSTSPATAAPTSPQVPAFAANGGPAAAVGAPLLQQVKPTAGVDLSRVTSPKFGYNGGTLAMEPPHRAAGLVSLSVQSGAPASAPRRRTWSAPVRALGVVDVSGRVRGVAVAKGSASYGEGDRSTYYYPPDEKFVVPAEPRLPPRFVVPAPPSALNGEAWETVPKPQPPWGAANGPLSFGYIESAPKPFAFQLPYDWDNSMRNRLVLPHGPAPSVPPGPFDLLPGRRLEIRRFPLIRTQTQGGNTESYAYLHDNRFVAPADAPFSTFSVDVDTASYANVRRFIERGRLPPPDAVRIEELLNYFPYHYPAPAAATANDRESAAPFAASLEVADAPWAPTHRLVRIGLKARDVVAANRPAANLVFLLDVSGSMADRNKLPLVKESMRLLIDALRPDDRVAIVTYAGTSGLALPSTPASHSDDILEALEALTAGGSTNGGMGIQLAYDIAKANFVKGGTNRVILCTDGDFNVGVTGQGDLVRLIQDKAQSGVMLTVLGFGMGNYKDSTLELLADKGNGNYGYIDSRAEATKLLRDQVDGTLNTVAKDVKVQVDFNPARVARYRLIGYEDRALNAQDFNDDTVDAGEIGAGHTVTALYEIVPVGVEEGSAPSLDRSRYAAAPSASRSAAAHADELLTVKVRYKQPDADVSRKLEFPLVDTGERFAAASADFKFSAAVAEFGMILRHSPYRGAASLGDVIASAVAGSAKPEDDPQGLRKDFVELALRAQRLMREPQSR